MLHTSLLLLSLFGAKVGRSTGIALLLNGTTSLFETCDDCSDEDTRYSKPELETKFECNPRDPLACDRHLREVCAFVDSTYRCQCSPNYSRNKNGICSVTNECAEPGLNDCHSNATCIDTPDAYSCTCNEGFIDFSSSLPGRACVQDVDECQAPLKYNVSCDPNARCKNTPHSFTCRCNFDYYDVSEKFNLPAGRRCEKKFDPCSSESTNECSPNAKCISSKGSYTCQCKDGFEDVSPNKFYPGRACRLITAEDSQQVCLSQGTNRTEYTQCECGSHDCDVNADCIQKKGSFDCRCKLGFFDKSPNPNVAPGRVCIKEENKCANINSNDCSIFARCIQSINVDYQCQCLAGYLDVSRQYNKPPGRHCIKEQNECSHTILNSCDPNAYCIKKPDGYACLCQEGFHDVSSSAKLKPGRVCTLVTTCPTQPTDLMFLIDGSFSIGQQMFKQEVLRFVSDFVSLFTLGYDDTLVSVIQYSHYVRKEIRFGQFVADGTSSDLRSAIKSIRYLKGMTRTGVAINYMIKKGFSASNGARGDRVKKIAVVVTDGMAQDDVKKPAISARKSGVTLFAVGVGEYVSRKQLREIAGGREDHVFIVGAFKELNTKLRAVMQRKLCPSELTTDPNICPKCDASRNYVCHNGSCVCPRGFCEDPMKKICGGDQCNPELASAACPYPLVCTETSYGSFGCACPSSHFCYHDGSCITNSTILDKCPGKLTRNPLTNECEGCHPSCDASKKQICLRLNFEEYRCDCPDKYVLDQATQVCTINECFVPNMNNCSANAKCVDTLEGFYCTCLAGFIDKDPDFHPGTKCEKIENPCLTNKHDCSENAECIADLQGQFRCKCKEHYVDMYPVLEGRHCEHRDNECLDPERNNCSTNAHCKDLDVGYTCFCQFGFQDTGDPLLDLPGRICVTDPCQDLKLNTCWKKRCRVLDVGSGRFACDPCPHDYFDAMPDTPGRICKPKIKPCFQSSTNDCDENAFCIGVKGSFEKYTCQCRDGFLDMSRDPVNKPGRLCEKIFNPCMNSSTNDCDVYATCVDSRNNMFHCSCKAGFLDVSTDPRKPGRSCLKLINECLNPQLHKCSHNAVCVDTDYGYECYCRPGYRDTSKGDLTGRLCEEIPDPCSSSTTNDCDPAAVCTRLGFEEDFNCSCPLPYRDSSAGPSKRSGRKCYYDGCGFQETNVCHPDAQCFNRNGYVECQCKEGFVDTKPGIPGVKCEPEPLCGLEVCRKSRGLVCDNTILQCTCEKGSMRRSPDEPCRKVRPVRLYLWVSRRNDQYYTFNETFSSPSTDESKEFQQLFVQGINQTISQLDPLSDLYFTSKVNNIQNPILRHVHWTRGLWVEYTAYFDATTPPSRSSSFHPLDTYAVWKAILDEITLAFNYSIGGTDLFVDEYQQPYACYNNDCHPEAVCNETSPDSYACACPERMVDVSDDKLEQPGRKCLLDPCLDYSSHQCDSKTSTCVTQTDGTYACQCKLGYTKEIYTDESGAAAAGHHKCHVDFCLDFPECPALNGTCRNYPFKAHCQCRAGFADLRQFRQQKRLECHGDTICLKSRDVDHCCLGSHECHPSALCVPSLAANYKCMCDDQAGLPNREIGKGMPCYNIKQAVDQLHLRGRRDFEELTADERDVDPVCRSCYVENRCTRNCQCTTWFAGEGCWLNVKYVLYIFLTLAVLLLVVSFVVLVHSRHSSPSPSKKHVSRSSDLSHFSDTLSNLSIKPVAAVEGGGEEQPWSSRRDDSECCVQVVKMSRFLDGHGLDLWDESISDEEIASFRWANGPRVRKID